MWHRLQLHHRHGSLKDYCKGLMLPLERKSVEPIAAAIEPDNVRQKHQSLHHFVADAPWSDQAVLDQVHHWALPVLLADKDQPVWTVDARACRKRATTQLVLRGNTAGNWASARIAKWW